MHQWQVSGDDLNGKSQTTFSPRAQFAIKPDWDKDMVFRDFWRILSSTAIFIESCVIFQNRQSKCKKHSSPFILL